MTLHRMATVVGMLLASSIGMTMPPLLGRQAIHTTTPDGCDETNHRTKDDWNKGSFWTYLGTLDGRDRIGFTVRRGDEALEGLYFEAADLVDHRVRVCLGPDRGVNFVILANNATISARFRGQFAEVDPKGMFGGGRLEREVIVGDLETVTRAGTRTVYLAMSHGGFGRLENMYEAAGVRDDRLVDVRAKAFQAAVSIKDRALVAGMIRFPITVILGGRRTRIESTTELLRVYEQVFTSTFTTRLVAAIPHHMFSRDQGVMLGNGEIWFDDVGQVIAINN